MKRFVLTVIFAISLASVSFATEYQFPYGYTMKSCEQAHFGGATLPWDAAGIFIPECAPDVLYSWQPQSAIDELKSESSLEDFLPISEMYLWRTPVGSFAYGDASIRLKLWPGAEFKLIEFWERDCKALNQKYGQVPLVYAVYNAGIEMNEYLICSSAPVMSWSHNHPQMLEEARREVVWVSQNTNDQSYDRMVRSECHTVPWHDYTVDRKGDAPYGWNVERLEKNLKLMKEREDSRIYFAPGAVEFGEKFHLRTKSPSYFNPYSLN